MPTETRDEAADRARREPCKPARETPSLKEAADRCRTTPSGKLDPSPQRTGRTR